MDNYINKYDPDRFSIKKSDMERTVLARSTSNTVRADHLSHNGDVHRRNSRKKVVENEEN